MNAPFWAKREFRLLLTILIIAGAALAVLIFEILPAISGSGRRGGDLEASREAFLPKESAPPRPLDPKLAARLGDIKDYSPIGENGDGYTALLETINDPGVMPAAPPPTHTPYTLFSKIPADLRGRPVSITALLLDWKMMALDHKAGNADFIYRLYLVDPAGNDGYVADLLREPNKSIEQRTLVALDGLFCKMGTYESQKGIVSAPLIVGHGLRKVIEKYESSTFPLHAITIAVGLLSLALLVLTLWLQFQFKNRRKKPIPPLDPLPPPGWKRSWGTHPSQFSVSAPPQSEAKPASAPAPAPVRVLRTRGKRRLPSVSLSRGQRRLLLLIIGAGLGAFVLTLGYDRWKAGMRDAPIDLESAGLKLHADAGAAREKIAAVQKPAWESARALDDADRRAIREQLGILEKSAVDLLTLLETARRQNPAGVDAAIARLAPRLLQIQLWILDAGDVIESGAAAAAGAPPATPGFFIPFHAAVARWKQAEADLAALQAAGRTAGEQQAEAGRRAAATALQTSLEEVRAAFTRLETYVKQGLTREDLLPAQLPELEMLAQHAALLQKDLALAAELAAEGRR